MLTVADLRTHLERMPADTPVYLCSVTPPACFTTVPAARSSKSTSTSTQTTG